MWAALEPLSAGRAAARPQSYATARVVQADYASRTMRYGGIVIVLFLVFHLAQLTWGVEAVQQRTSSRGSAYHNLTAVFQSPRGYGIVFDCAGRAGISSLSRRVEYVPDARPEQPTTMTALIKGLA